MTKHRFVVLGGGVAGLVVAMRLGQRFGRRGRAEVTLVDHAPAHVWKPMLHTFASGTADYRNESLSYIDHAARNGYRFVPGDLAEVDRARKELSLDPVLLHDGTSRFGGGKISYDTLVVAVGSHPNDFGTPGAVEHCHFLNDVTQAECFHDALRAASVNALSTGEDVTVAIVGGGATGVELASELTKGRDILSRYLPKAKAPKLRITLIESGMRLLGGLPQQVSDAATSKLRQLGVVVELNAKVTSVDGSGLALAGGHRVEAKLRVWAAGVQAPRLLSQIQGLELSKAGQLVVGPTLQTTRDPAIFALGDCASLVNTDGKPVPTTAQAARQEAVFLASMLYRCIRFGRPLRNFKYRDFGSVVSLGGYTAYGTLGRHGLLPATFMQGRVAQFGHAALYRMHQLELNGPVQGTALWFADRLRRAARPGVRLD